MGKLCLASQLSVNGAGGATSFFDFFKRLEGSSPHDAAVKRLFIDKRTVAFYFQRISHKLSGESRERLGRLIRESLEARGKDELIELVLARAS